MAKQKAKKTKDGSKFLGSGLAKKAAKTIKASQKKRHDRLKKI